MQPATKPTYNLAPLDNSVVFKKLFRDADVLNAFIYDLLGLQLNIHPEQIETEKKFTPPIGNIDISYDIFVDDPVHRIIIEIQRVRYNDHYERFFYYFLAAILERAKSYKDYQQDRTVYTIVWLTGRTQDQTFQRSIITNSVLSETNQGEILSLYPHKLLFLNPNYVDEQTPAGVRDWMQLVSESVQNPTQPTLNFTRPIIEHATQLIDEDGLTPQEIADLIDEINYQKHLAEKYQEGREEGREEGIRLGQLQTLRDMIRAMLPQRFPALQDSGLPDWVQTRLNDTEDLTQLQAWSQQIWTVESIEALFT